MGDASSRGTREERVAAALAADDARRGAWADEMVADAAALLESAKRAVLRGRSPADFADGALPLDTPMTVQEEHTALALASLAAQRAVAADLVDAVTAEDGPELDDYEPPEPIPRAAAKSGSCLPGWRERRRGAPAERWLPVFTSKEARRFELAFGHEPDVVIRD